MILSQREPNADAKKKKKTANDGWINIEATSFYYK
jgi:hypothetical protein